MNIKSIPNDYTACEKFNFDYERQHFRYSETNKRVAIPTRDMFLGRILPKLLWPLGRPFQYAAMDGSIASSLRIS